MFGLHKNGRKPTKKQTKRRLEDDFALGVVFLQISSIFVDSGRFWDLLGGPWGGIFGVFWVANSGRIFGRILEAGAAVPRWLL